MGDKEVVTKWKKRKRREKNELGPLSYIYSEVQNIKRKGSWRAIGIDGVTLSTNRKGDQPSKTSDQSISSLLALLLLRLRKRSSGGLRPAIINLLSSDIHH